MHSQKHTKEPWQGKTHPWGWGLNVLESIRLDEHKTSAGCQDPKNPHLMNMKEWSTHALRVKSCMPMRSCHLTLQLRPLSASTARALRLFAARDPLICRIILQTQYNYSNIRHVTFYEVLSLNMWNIPCQKIDKNFLKIMGRRRKLNPINRMSWMSSYNWHGR